MNFGRCFFRGNIKPANLSFFLLLFIYGRVAFAANCPKEIIQAFFRTHEIPLRMPYKFLHQEKGRFGGSLWVLGRGFFPVYERPLVKQGDVNRWIDLLGTEKAAVLGFQILDFSHGISTIPDVSELFGIQKYFLENTALWSLKLSPVKGRISSQESLRLFSFDSAMPLAEDLGLEQLHDTLVHGIRSQFVPPRHIDLSGRQGRMLFEFIEYIKSDYPELWMRKDVQDIMENCIRIKALDVDAGTGNIDVALFSQPVDSTKTKDLIKFTHAGSSPIVFLERRLGTEIVRYGMDEVTSKNLRFALRRFIRFHQNTKEWAEGFSWTPSEISRELQNHYEAFVRAIPE